MQGIYYGKMLRSWREVLNEGEEKKRKNGVNTDTAEGAILKSL